MKDDEGKIQFSLLTRGLAHPLKAVAHLLTYGAKKYCADSWQTTENPQRRYEDALDRHLNEWKSGREYDHSGFHHLVHIAANVLFLLWFHIIQTGCYLKREENNPDD